MLHSAQSGLSNLSPAKKITKSKTSFHKKIKWTNIIKLFDGIFLSVMIKTFAEIDIQARYFMVKAWGP
jgi:hypothetical protein